MKVLAVVLLCAIAGGVAGSAVAWPGALAVSSPLALSSPVAVSSPLVKTFLPGTTKTTAYSTTQYINAIPAPYTFGVHQQFAVPLSQPSGFASIQPGYYPVAGSPFVSAANLYYPSHSFTPIVSGFGPANIVPGVPAAPVAPGAPSPGETSSSDYPSGPSNQPAGDADSAVIESADSNIDQARQENPAAAPSAPPSSAAPPSPSQPPSQPMPPANLFPNFPGFPQIPQGNPSLPSLPQIPQNLPQVPQIPGFPQFPQLPPNLFPQGPSQAPPSSFPSAINNDQGLNDEDTISVESA